MALKLGELAAVIKADDRQMEQGLDQAESKFRRFGSKLEPMAAGFGAAAALALAAGLAGAMTLDAAQTRLEAQLGNTEYAAQAGQIAGRVYARGFGESAQEIGDAVRAILASGLVPEDAGAEVIEDLTVKAQSLAQVFDVDVTQAARAAGQMIRTGLAEDGAEAMDILTAAFRQTGDQAGDLLDTYSEYGTQFRKLGLDGREATGILIQGLKAGARDVDTVADAVKEFSIRAIDGSKKSSEGFRALGLDAKSMTAQIAAGGEGAQKGLDTVLDRLRAMEDPVARDAAAVALFGTKAEDLGASLYALDPSAAAGRLGDVTGAANELGDTLEQSASQRLEAFKRQVQGALVEKLAEAIPHLEGMAKWMGENKAILEPLVTVLGALAIVIGTIIAVTKVWTAVQTALNIVMMMNPLGLIVLAIIAIIAGIVLLWQNSETFRNIVTGVFGAVWAAIKFVWDWIKDNWKLLLAILTGPIGLAVYFITKHWDDIKAGAGKVKDWIVDKWNALVGFVTGLPGRLARAARGMWDGIKNAFKSAVNWIIGKWNNLSFRIPGISVPGLGQVWGGATLSTPDLPMLATGGTTTRAGMAITGERGREAVYLPAGARVEPNRYGGAHAEAAVQELLLRGEFRVRGSDLVLVLRDKAQITPGGIVALVDG